MALCFAMPLPAPPRQAAQLEYRQVTSFKITTSIPAPLNIDGEIKGTTQVTVTLEPRAVQLL